MSVERFNFELNVPMSLALSDFDVIRKCLEYLLENVIVHESSAFQGDMERRLREIVLKIEDFTVEAARMRENALKQHMEEMRGRKTENQPPTPVEPGDRAGDDAGAARLRANPPGAPLHPWFCGEKKGE